MTLYEFNKLTFEEKQATVWDKVEQKCLISLK